MALRTPILQYPEALQDDDNRKIIKANLISLGTYLVLRGGSSQRLPLANWCAQAILSLEDFDERRKIRRQIETQEASLQAQNITHAAKGKQRSVARPLIQARDLCDGGNRALIRFFSKRTPCSCLDEKNEMAKSQPKKGWCFLCNRFKEYSQLKVCSRCKLSQYCSVECQRADWPTHKETCADITAKNRLAARKVP